MLVCGFCKKEFNHSNTGSLKAHENGCKANPLWVNDFEKRSVYTRLSRNKAQATMIERYGATCWNKDKKTGPKILSADGRRRVVEANKRQVWSPERRKKLADSAKKRGLGGHTSKNQIYYELKSGEVVYLQSSYEIRFAEILDRLDIEWERPEPFIWRDATDEEHRYYPDFKIGEIYLDTKNDYLAVKDLPKIKAVREQNKLDLRIVTKDQINEEYIRAL